MKFLLITLAVIAAVSGQQYGGQQLHPQEPIPIVRQQQDSQPDGSYQYSYETANGIQITEQGTLGQYSGEDGPAVNVQGQYSYTGDDGVVYALSYTADETGYHPVGAHLPTTPATPESILRSLEYIRTHPQPDQQ